MLSSSSEGTGLVWPHGVRLHFYLGAEHVGHLRRLHSGTDSVSNRSPNFIACNGRYLSQVVREGGASRLGVLVVVSTFAGCTTSNSKEGWRRGVEDNFKMVAAGPLFRLCNSKRPLTQLTAGRRRDEALSFLGRRHVHIYTYKRDCPAVLWINERRDAQLAAVGSAAALPCKSQRPGPHQPGY